MKKAKPGKTKRKKRINKKQDVPRVVFILTLILFLSILLIYLIPNKIERTGIGEEDESGKERVTEKPFTSDPEKERKDSSRENDDKRDFKKKGIKETDGRKLAIVIDDAGNNIQDLLPFLQFPGKLTIAVLPQLPGSTEAARLIAESGKEVLLHQPMEPENNLNPGPGALYSTHTEKEVIDILEKNLESVPGAVGVNNHMGSKITAETDKMDTVFRFLSRRGLFFLDSRTTSRSVCRETASRLGIPLLERHIFLDNIVSRDAIRDQMQKGITLAGKNNYVIIIGHVQNSEVLDVLYEFLPEIEANTCTFVGLSDIYGK
jgi:polysaccharide deacetylase 2 family uncharacterized protein YibQ